MNMKLILVTAFLSSVSASAATPADNTAVNDRDREKAELTADQQKNNTSDVEITRRIRQDLVKNNSLSTYAHNVKIITVNGVVTLKGPVRSEEERSVILRKAQAEVG